MIYFRIHFCLLKLTYQGIYKSRRLLNSSENIQCFSPKSELLMRYQLHRDDSEEIEELDEIEDADNSKCLYHMVFPRSSSMKLCPIKTSISTS